MVFVIPGTRGPEHSQGTQKAQVQSLAAKGVRSSQRCQHLSQPPLVVSETVTTNEKNLEKLIKPQSNEIFAVFNLRPAN